MKNLPKFISIPLLLLAIASCQSPRRHGGDSTRTTPTSNPTSETSATSEGTSVTSEATSATSQGTSTTSQGTSSTSTGTSVTSAGTSTTSAGTSATSTGTSSTSHGTSTTSTGTSSTSHGTSTTSAGTSSTSHGTSATSRGTSATSSTSGDAPVYIKKTKLSYTYDDYQKNNVYELDNCPLVDNPKLLIIPIWFTDSTYFISSSKKARVKADIQATYLGTDSETGWRSVKTFYEEESLGKLHLQGTVTDWYECGKSSTYMGSDDYGDRTTTLLDSAVSWYFSNNSSDSRKNYDTNSDGYLDGVMMIYAAADSRANSSAGDNLWAYCYWSDNSASTSNPTAKTFLWASYDFMYDSSNAYSRTGASSYGSGDCSHCTLDAHTFIHEMGHVLGLEDYYDYHSTELCPAGAFSMQDWNMGGHDPYSVMAYGWADPYIPTTTATITLNDFQSSHDVILLANHTGINSPFDEYLLIEFYTPTGLNKLDSDYAYANYEKGPNQSGIRVWHVDARLTYATSISGQYINWSPSFITNPNASVASNGVYHAMANSYGGDYGSVMGSSYYNYNLLQFIRNNTSTTYRDKNQMKNSDLFKQGDTFTMSSYQKQFVNSTKMNNSQNLGWSFKVDSISGSQATITVTKG